MNSINFCGTSIKPILETSEAVAKNGTKWHPVPGKVNVEMNAEGTLRINNGVTTLEDMGNGTYKRTVLNTGEETIEKSKIPPKKSLNLIG